MNINVIVVNMPHDFRPVDVGDFGREREERFARAFSRSGSVTPPGAACGATPIEEVIELIPRNGAWVGLTAGQKALHTSPAVATYDHEGKVRYSSRDKGLRVDITA
jgi:hypothetical protein